MATYTGNHEVVTIQRPDRDYIIVDRSNILNTISNLKRRQHGYATSQEEFDRLLEMYEGALTWMDAQPRETEKIIVLTANTLEWIEIAREVMGNEMSDNELLQLAISEWLA